MNARISAALAISLGLLFPIGAPQAAESPLAHFGGNWSGSGKIVVSNGSSERIRCRGVYKPSDSGLALTLRCASDSYKFELASKATATHIEASASSVGFTASLTISLRGNSQTVVIRSPGSEISEVSISMARGGR